MPLSLTIPFATLFSIFRSRCPRAGEPGSAPPNRRPSAVREKTPGIVPVGSLVVGLIFPHLERLALGTGHRQTRNRHCVASRRFSPVLDLEGATGPTRTTSHSRELRDLIRKMCRENRGWGAPRIHGELLKLGFDIGESSVSKYMLRCRRPPSQTWRTFLENHAQQFVSIDFFTVPTLRFQILYVFLVLAHDRRRILHFNVTAHPTAEWTGQQLRDAFAFDQLPRYLLRDRDTIFGQDFQDQMRDMVIREVLSAPRSPLASEPTSSG